MTTSNTQDARTYHEFTRWSDATPNGVRTWGVHVTPNYETTGDTLLALIHELRRTGKAVAIARLLTSDRPPLRHDLTREFTPLELADLAPALALTITGEDTTDGITGRDTRPARILTRRDALTDTPAVEPDTCLYCPEATIDGSECCQACQDREDAQIAEARR